MTTTRNNAASSSPPTPADRRSDVDLQSRSDEFARVLADIAADEHGIICSEIHVNDMRPLQPGDVPAHHPLLKDLDGVTADQLCAYEDAGMSTGAFLASQSLCYELTGDPVARDNAQQAFAGVRYIYDLGKQRREGYFPKPYGGKISPQISRDQYLFILAGLTCFRRIADAKIKDEVSSMMGHMGHYWPHINYSHDYFGLPSGSHLDDFMGPLFLGIIRMAHAATDDQRLLQEYERLLEQEQLGPRTPETLRSRYLRGITYDGGAYFRQHEHCMMMKTMAVDQLWDRDADHTELWTQALDAFWRDDLRVGYDSDSGLCYGFVKFNVEKNETYLTEPGVVDDLENPLNLPMLTWGGRRQSAHSTQLAYSAAVVASRTGNPSPAAIAQNILQKVDLDRCRGMVVPGPEHIPPGEEFRQALVNTNFLASWLWAYWLGRHRKLW